MSISVLDYVISEQSLWKGLTLGPGLLCDYNTLC